jgi:uncharacterized membrane protein
MNILFYYIPKIDPLKKNIDVFRTRFNMFIVGISLFFFYVYILTLFWNTGSRFDFGQLLTPAFAVLWYLIGDLVGNAKRNWSIGIRTPWTMSSDAVWDKTHKLGAKIFKASAVIVLLGFFFPKMAFWFVIVSALATVVITFIYSYVKYKQEINQKVN